MSVKEFYIFFLFLTIRTICGVNFLTKIRADYCEQYCGNECKNDNVNENVKSCSKSNNTITTNNYELKLDGEYLELFWNTSYPDLKSLVRLNSYDLSLQALSVSSHYDEKQGLSAIPAIQYLQAFGINTLFMYHFRVLQLTITELHIDIAQGARRLKMHMDSNSTATNLLINSYLRRNTNNLEDISVWCRQPYKLPTIFFENFENQKNLTLLAIFKCNMKKVNASTFQHLHNLKHLFLINNLLENFELLSSAKLQNHLENITLSVDRDINLNYFQNYSKLGLIHLNLLSPTAVVIPCHNLQAFVCVWRQEKLNSLNYRPDCKFTIGINNKRCPQSCHCQLEYSTDLFIINCTDQGLREVPQLPIPRIGYTRLLFEGNKLSKLSNITDPGYANLTELYLSNNNLTYLNLDQLPPGLTLMDIRNNGIQMFDEKVASFLLNRINKTRLLQAGVLWISECENSNLTIYLNELGKKKEEPVYHHHLKGPCPDLCTCCFNGTSKQFVIDCRSRGLINFPILPIKIKGNFTLLLDDNQIEVLPQQSLRNSTLKELHLKNNVLTSLAINQLPPNITYLDIRNNSLNSLDDEVTQFLSFRSHNLTGNPWECKCEFPKFLTLLKNNYPEEYKAALRRCSGQEYCPPSCVCCLDDSGKFKINCSSQGLTEIPELPITNYSVLLFENNLLTNLSNNSPQGFDQLKELYLANNHIWLIEKVPSNLSLLDLEKNKLQRLTEGMVNLLTNQFQLTLSISGNPWICSCLEIRFLRFTRQFKGHIKDLCQVECQNSTLLIKMQTKDLCPLGIPGYVFFLIAIMGFTCTLNCLQYFRESIKMWFYDKNMCLGLAARREMDKEKIFDAFLAYTHKDAEFVDEYIEMLENGLHKFRLCYYERDWLLGLPIPACICQSVEDSKRIVILMTNNFLRSPWGRFELRLALHATSQDKCKRLIIVVYPDVENFDELDSELKLYMTVNTYLKRNDPNFWSKFIYAMPHNRKIG